MIYKRDYHGFIYLWFDRRRKKFCLGSHMGALDDGYISSTGHFKNAFKKRPDDMKRRILAYVSESREEMFREEQRWLDMIKDEELCVRYYNVKKRACGQDPRIAAESIRASWENEGIRQSRIEKKKEWYKTEKGQEAKINLGNRRRGIDVSDKTRQLISEKASGRVHTEEMNINQSKRLKEWYKTEEGLKLKAKLSENDNPLFTYEGHSHTEETRIQIGNTLRERIANGELFNEEHRKNLSKATKGKPKTKIQCSVCGDFVDPGNGKRWHFGNCKHKENPIG